jgi:hypothetical protein
VPRKQPQNAREALAPPCGEDAGAPVRHISVTPEV